ncbi:MAG TPA: hypothetical protein VIT19_10540 [Pyrinomonadaceae bacterium]
MAKREDPIDALFKLPLTEFIGARKKLAAQFKKDGNADEAERVKALAKPPVSAWTVNQLYWTHREAFDELLATGQRFRKAQTSGKMANMREALDGRREALSQLSDLATEILRDAGHNPSLDTLRRIATTLEALSSFESVSDSPTPGRLTRDVDPPGFDSFGSFVPSAAKAKRAPDPPKKSVTASSKQQSITASAEVTRRGERQAQINAAKVSLQGAKKSLAAARAMTKSLEAAQKRAEAVAKEAEKQRRQAEERFKKASAASEDAIERAQSIVAELTEATQALREAERTVEKATRELEASFQGA